MTTTRVVVEEWLDLAFEAAREVGTTLLGLSEITAVGHDTDPLRMKAGAYVPMICGPEKLHVGLVSTVEGCQRLTQAALGTIQDGEPPTDEDVADAVAEIANILGGVLQRSASMMPNSVELGLPIFVHGEVVASHVDTARRTVMLGEIEVDIVVIHGNPPGVAADTA